MSLECILEFRTKFHPFSFILAHHHRQLFLVNKKVVKRVSAAIQFNSYIDYYLQPRFIVEFVSWTCLPCRKFNFNCECLPLKITHTKCHIKVLQLFFYFVSFRMTTINKKHLFGRRPVQYTRTHTKQLKDITHEAKTQESIGHSICRVCFLLMPLNLVCNTFSLSFFLSSKIFHIFSVHRSVFMSLGSFSVRFFSLHPTIFVDYDFFIDSRFQTVALSVYILCSGVTQTQQKLYTPFFVR